MPNEETKVIDREALLNAIRRARTPNLALGSCNSCYFGGGGHCYLSGEEISCPRVACECYITSSEHERLPKPHQEALKDLMDRWTF